MINMIKLRRVLLMMTALTIISSVGIKNGQLVRADGELPPMAITEVCFNPKYKENDVEDVGAGADVFEYIEVMNMSSNDISLEGAAFYYKNGDNDWRRNNILPVGSGELGAGEMGIFVVYATDTAKVGIKYETQEDRQQFLEQFNELNGCSIAADNFFILPRNVNGTEELINQDGYAGFNLANSHKNVNIKLCDAEGNIYAQAQYNADKYSSNNTSLQFIYDSETGLVQAAGITRCTPGTYDKFQMLDDSLKKTLTGTPVRIMSYNVCASGITTDSSAAPHVMVANRSPRVIEMVLTQDPDIIAFQEVNYEWLRILRKNLEDDYENVGISGRGNANGDNGAIWDLYNCIFYKRDKYKEVSSGNFWLSSTPEEPGVFTWSDGVVGDFARVCTWIILEDKSTGVQFAVFNTHHDAKVAQSRMNGIQLELDKIEEIAAGYPVFALADYNFRENTTYYKAVLERGLLAARTNCADTMLSGSFTSWLVSDGRNLDAALPIDQCFYNPEYADIASYRVIVKSYTIANIEGAFPSDHCPIVINAFVREGSSQTGDSESNVKKWLIPVCIAVPVVALAAVLAVTISKRKKKAS